MDYDKFAADIAEAIKVGQKKIAKVHDGGSCNHDTIAIPVGRESVITRKSKKLEKALEARGIDPTYFDCTLPRYYSIGVPATGQGARNTLAVEAAVEYLKSNGWQVFVRYMVD